MMLTATLRQKPTNHVRSFIKQTCLETDPKSIVRPDICKMAGAISY